MLLWRLVHLLIYLCFVGLEYFFCRSSMSMMEFGPTDSFEMNLSFEMNPSFEMNLSVEMNLSFKLNLSFELNFLLQISCCHESN